MATILCRRYGCRLRKNGDTYLLVREGRQIRLATSHRRDLIEVARHFDTYFAQVVPSIVHGVREVDYSQARLHTLANGLPFELSSLPEKFPTLDVYFQSYKPKSGDLVFDIGAYCGVLTYELSQRVGAAGTVVAFEPDPTNAQLLRRNMERHKLRNVVVVEVALSDRSGTAQFRSDGSRASTLSFTPGRPPSSSATTVWTMTLEDACRAHGIPDFIKMDAGGSEIEILSGAQQLLRDHQLHFVVDTSHIRYGTTTNSLVESIFEHCNYRAESSAEPGGFMTTWAAPSAKQAADIA